MSARKRKEPAASVRVVYLLLTVDGRPFSAHLTRQEARDKADYYRRLGHRRIVRRCEVVETKRKGGGA